MGRVTAALSPRLATLSGRSALFDRPRSFAKVRSNCGLAEFAPVSLIQLYVVFLGGGLDPFPGGIAFRIRHPLHLLEAGDRVAHVSSVMDGFFAFVGECEVLVGDMIAIRAKPCLQ